MTLFFTACIYPPFLLVTEGGIPVERKWGWIFTLLPTPYEVPEIDLITLFIEATIAILLAIGISLILFRIKAVIRQRGRSVNKINNHC